MPQLEQMRSFNYALNNLGDIPKYKATPFLKNLLNDFSTV